MKILKEGSKKINYSGNSNNSHFLRRNLHVISPDKEQVVYEDGGTND